MVRITFNMISELTNLVTRLTSNFMTNLNLMSNANLTPKLKTNLTTNSNQLVLDVQLDDELEVTGQLSAQPENNLEFEFEY